MSSASFTSSISNNSAYVSSETSSPIEPESYDFNYTVSRQNIYSYYDYTKIIIILFIIMFAIYLIVIYNKFN